MTNDSKAERSVQTDCGSSDCYPLNIKHECVCADSELSAIAHGRPPTGDVELLRIAHAFREYYENGLPIVLDKQSCDDLIEALAYMVTDVEPRPKLQRYKDLSDWLWDQRKQTWGEPFVKSNG